MRKSFAVCIVALGIAGCAREFPVTPLSADEQRWESEIKSIASTDAMLTLGQMYFLHNRIDEADVLLKDLVAQEPDNAQAQAWYGANNCKKAGRRGPLLMGLDKLYLVHQCLEEIEQALRRQPDDFVVQMVQMNTGAEINMFESLDRARLTMERVSERLRHSPTLFSSDMAAQFYVTAAKIERISGNWATAAQIIEGAAALNATDATKELIAAERNALLADRAAGKR
jgi:hypothetical protein